MQVDGKDGYVISLTVFTARAPCTKHLKLREKNGVNFTETNLSQ